MGRRWKQRVKWWQRAAQAPTQTTTSRQGIPEIDELVNKGREQLRVLMGGGNGGGKVVAALAAVAGPALTRGTVGLGILGALVLWGMASFYTVKPEEQSVELLLGQI